MFFEQTAYIIHEMDVDIVAFRCDKVFQHINSITKPKIMIISAAVIFAKA